MSLQYNEEDILLILNYDTNSKKVLTLEDRCLLHQWSNDIHYNRKITVDDYLKSKAASVLTEISYRKYHTIKSHYIMNEEKNKILLINNF